MAEANSDLPARPKDFPRLVPGKLDLFRVIALALCAITLILQIVLIAAPHEAKNDYGTVDTIDPVGFPFVRPASSIYLALLELTADSTSSRDYSTYI
jgi:hypothetical protein